MKYAHTSIFVSDFTRSLHFYQEIVGLKIVRQLDHGPDNQIAFLAHPDDTTQIELIYNKEESFHGSGLLLGFEVADAAAYHEVLKTKGMQPTPIVSPHPGVQFFFIKDPDGVTIQFVEES